MPQDLYLVAVNNAVDDNGLLFWRYNAFHLPDRESPSSKMEICCDAEWLVSMNTFGLGKKLTEWNKTLFFLTQDTCGTVRERILYWTIVTGPKRTFPPSAKENDPVNHMDMPHYSMNTISHQGIVYRQEFLRATPNLKVRSAKLTHGFSGFGMVTRRRFAFESQFEQMLFLLYHLNGACFSTWSKNTV